MSDCASEKAPFFGFAFGFVALQILYLFLRRRKKRIRVPVLHSARRSGAVVDYMYKAVAAYIENAA